MYAVMIKLGTMLLSFTVLLGCSNPAPHSVDVAEAKVVFASHDCCGRLANTGVVKVGDIKVGTRIFSIFDLSFVNPGNSHGMQCIAILEGAEFRGSYITGFSKTVIDGTTIKFTCDDDMQKADPRVCDLNICGEIDLMQPLPQKMLIDGEFHKLEQTI